MPPSAIQRLRGFKDIYGDEALLFSHIEQVARVVFKSFDFEEIRLPALEEKALFSRALGSDTDVVQKEMYEFTDRSDVAVAMRPEGTAGIVRAYIENNFDKTQGWAKLFYMGPMFRSERPQAGRLRQFHQLGVEQLGTPSPYADAETILCLTTFLDRVGLAGYKLRLNNLGTLAERKELKKELVDYFKPRLASFCPDFQKRFERNVFRLLDCKVQECRKAVREVPWIKPGEPLVGESISAGSLEHFREVCAALDSVKAPYEIDPFMVRGLDYYTKTVFEVSHPGLGSQDALAAGGRYDDLIESFGGDPAGAVGFALGVERLILCGQFSRNLEKLQPIVIATMGENALKLGFVLLNALRRLGIPSIMELKPRSLKSQLRLAEKKKSRYVVLIGDEEIERRMFVLKDMQAGGEGEKQVEYDLDQLMERFIELYRERYHAEQWKPDFVTEPVKKD